ncbi:MAG: bifunctional (p)ppGpp synthetase/guanosine-3',5'-bis(diphosphate) 3'-pyrophosphohydrolase [Myxococcales bacterium]|nr:bifunctional (p)ppGpp synthetase/guanosine-3',5'-bis(diphosphate) 3'-pyrophosphohydrolase [Myxococcales bacterium]
MDLASLPHDVRRAREFARAAHGDQRYGAHPYVVHLDDVVEILAGLPARDEPTLIAGYLHDVVEDTDVTLVDVEEAFDVIVARCVALLTDAPGESRKQRKAATYARLARVADGAPEARALVVKAADRLANVRRSVEDQNRRLLEMYRREHAAFRGAARRPGLTPALWDELDYLLEWTDEETP